MSGITFTFDLENHRNDQEGADRLTRNTHAVLEFLAEHQITATVFAVGELVRDHRPLLRTIAEAGHELALHSYRHTPLTAEQPDQFRQGIAQDMEGLAEISGAAVKGFRAPVFSLTESSLWAIEVLGELGFSYSSSVLPLKHPLFGFPNVPRTPFRWPNGMLELPVPVASFFGLTIPYLGGIYARYVPLNRVLNRLQHQPAEAVLWSYLHPYDIDTSEGYFQFPGTSHLMSLLLWRRRGDTLNRIQRIMSANGTPAPTLIERVSALSKIELPEFSKAA